MAATTFLDYTQRPSGLQSDISSAYNQIAHHTSSRWGVCNGSTAYGTCGVDEHALMKKLISQAPEGRKDFYALDIGCGNFQWSQGLAAFINKQTDLPKDIKVHIFSIRGEGYFGDRVVEIDRCTLYNLGAFRVEELFSQFKALGFDLENKVDLAVSQWCFRHLADPVGTLAQTYNLLRPETGFLLVDGFFLLYEQRPFIYEGNTEMTQLFLDTKAPFLTRFYDNMRSLNHFILRRPNATACQLPMSYSGTRSPQGEYQIGSGCITVFKREPQEEDREGFCLPDGGVEDYKKIYGNKKMYDWLKTNELLVDGRSLWRPLQDKDLALRKPPLHAAICIGNDDEARVCIDRGDDISESDTLGRTPLHLSIQELDYDLFQLLLVKGAHVGLRTGKGDTPLHKAARVDTEGRFLQSLIEARADVNARAMRWDPDSTPLCSAIQVKNLKALELLIKAGATIAEKNEDALRDPAFQPLREQGLIREVWQGIDGFSAVYNWIKEGNCVVLHHSGWNAIMYHYPNAENRRPKLIVVDVNPQTSLLDDCEWPDFLKVHGYKYAPFNQDKVNAGKFTETSHYRFGY